MRVVKFLLPLALVAALALSACNTLENRRSLYSYQKVHGPYTRALEEGTWGNPKPVDEEYREGQRSKNQPKLIYEKKSSSGSGVSVPTPETELPSN